MRLNYLRGWGGDARVDIGAQGLDLAQRFTGGRFGSMGEVGFGGTVGWPNRLSIYAEADWQTTLGKAGARGWGLNLGARWDF